MERIYKLLLVKPNERGQVGYFILVYLLIGTGMALGRGTADALFLKRYGFEYLPIMYAVLALVLATVSIAYAAYADRISSERFFRIIFSTLAITLTANWGLMAFTTTELAYPIYFLVYEVASELLLLHAALYLNQNIDTLQAKRLTPIIFSAAQVGTIIGGLTLASVATRIGVHNILLLWTAVLLASIVLIAARHRKVGVSPYYQPTRARVGGLRQSLDQVKQGLLFAKTSDLLRSASFALFFMVIAFYILCYSINRIYANSFTTEESLSAFFGILTAITSALSLLTHLFITGRLLHRFGVKTTNLIFPSSGIATYGVLLLSFSLPAALIGSLVRDVLLPAIRRPTRNLFFNSLPDYMQGRTRALAVALVLPVALLTASCLLLVTQKLGNPIYFLIPGLIATFIYLYYCTRMNRAYLTSMLSTLRDKVFIPGNYMETVIKSGDKEIIEELERSIQEPDDAIALTYARVLIEGYPERAAQPILKRLQTAKTATRDVMILLLAPLRPEGLLRYCRKSFSQTDPHLQATIAQVLFSAKQEQDIPLIYDCLKQDNPRLITAGIEGVHQYGLGDLTQHAATQLHELLISPTPDANIAALEHLTQRPVQDYVGEILDLLETAPNQRVQIAALNAINKLPNMSIPGLKPVLETLYSSLNPDIRRLCVACYRFLPDEQTDVLALAALDDGHYKVRDTAINLLDDNTSQFEETLSSLILGNAGSPRAQKSLLHYLIMRHAHPSLFAEIAEAKVADATELSNICLLAYGFKHQLTYAAGSLFSTLLNERKHQVVDLALLAMEQIEDPIAIRVIRASLQSGDQRQIANACEALRNIKNEKLAHELSSLLEQTDNTRDAANIAKGELNSIDKIFTWCEQRPDPWLRTCVSHLRSNLRPAEA